LNLKSTAFGNNIERIKLPLVVLNPVDKTIAVTVFDFEFILLVVFGVIVLFVFLLLISE
jgi:hypothetical protein